MPDASPWNSKLMDAAAAGDAAAFGHLASAVGDDLFRFSLANGLKTADAAEAAQETLLRAFRNRHAWRSGADVRCWMLGIAMNVSREFRRKGRRLAGGVDALELNLPAPAPDEPPGDAVALAAALPLLPDRQREAIVCRFLRGLSVKETAEVMGCAEGTVKAAVFAGLKNLRARLGEGNG